MTIYLLVKKKFFLFRNETRDTLFTHTEVTTFVVVPADSSLAQYIKYVVCQELEILIFPTANFDHNILGGKQKYILSSQECMYVYVFWYFTVFSDFFILLFFQSFEFSATQWGVHLIISFCKTFSFYGVCNISFPQSFIILSLLLVRYII